jgi:hypothetical protein
MKLFLNIALFISLASCRDDDLASMPDPTYPGVNLNDIGSGYPATRAFDNGTSIVIYRDKIINIGAGTLGAACYHNITRIAEQGPKVGDDALINSNQQVYPLAPGMCFTDGFDSAKVYLAKDGAIAQKIDITKISREIYALDQRRVFLGCLDGQVYYHEDNDLTKLYKMDVKSQSIKSANIPKGILKIQGVTRGIRKDVGLFVLRKSPGLAHVTPNTFDFIELSDFK